MEMAELWVASWPDDLSTVVGWCVCQPGIVHYVYTLKDYRREGIATRLLAPFAGQPFATTHTTKAGLHLLAKLSRQNHDPSPVHPLP